MLKAFESHVDAWYLGRNIGIVRIIRPPKGQEREIRGGEEDGQKGGVNN